MILRATRKDIYRVRVYCGDGGVDSFTGRWGETGQLDVYQMKYFITPWTDSQKQEIRDSYKTAANSTEYNLQDWTLVVPSDLTKKDWQWFDNWREKTAKTAGRRIRIMTGATLVDLLARSECAAAREKLSEWRVQGLPSGARWEAWAVIVPNMPIDPKFSVALLVNVWLQNVGDKSAHNVRLKLEHSPNDMRNFSPDQKWWRETATSLNPWYSPPRFPSEFANSPMKYSYTRPSISTPPASDRNTSLEKRLMRPAMLSLSRFDPA